MLTKEEINECNDGQQLSDWAAKYCMGWTKTNTGYMEYITESEDGEVTYHYAEFHLDRDKGKAQCWDLIMKYGFIFDVDGGHCSIGKEELLPEGWIVNYMVEHENPQIAVLKAALLSEIGN